MIVKGCVIFERTLLSRKKSHNLAWSCAISNIFYCVLRIIQQAKPQQKKVDRTTWPIFLAFIALTMNDNAPQYSNKESGKIGLWWRMYYMSFDLQEGLLPCIHRKWEYFSRYVIEFFAKISNNWKWKWLSWLGFFLPFNFSTNYSLYFTWKAFCFNDIFIFLYPIESKQSIIFV